jgi:hypothetical protein
VSGRSEWKGIYGGCGIIPIETDDTDSDFQIPTRPFEATVSRARNRLARFRVYPLHDEFKLLLAPISFLLVQSSVSNKSCLVPVEIFMDWSVSPL